MALPPGVTTCVVTFGAPASGFVGEDVSTSVTITPSQSIYHAATGAPLLAFTIRAEAGEGLPGSVSLPHTDQEGFLDAAGNQYTNWAYTAEGVWRSGGTTIPFKKNFQLPSGQSVVDLDLIPNGTIGLPVVAPTATVTSFLGKTGPIEAEDLEELELGGGVPDDGVTEAKLAPEVRDQIASKATLTGMYPAVPLYGYGNSWMDAAGFFGALPSRFGFSLSGNRAVGGHRVQDTAITALSPGVGEWTPGSGVVVVNDLGNNLADPDDAANRGAALESARALCAVLSSASKTESTGWSFSTSPAWSDTAMGYAGASGDSYAISTNDGAYVDFPVPAGTSYLTVFGGDGAAFKTGTVTVTQGGRTFTKATNEKARATAYRASLGVAPVVVRLDGMSAGTARATFTTGGVAGAVSAVDCLLTLSPSPPAIVWIKPVVVTATGYTGKAALLTYLRSIPDVLAQEFPNVVVVDPAAGWDPDSMLGPDGLHPNGAGWAHVGDAVSAALVKRSVGGLDETAVDERIETVGDARYASLSNNAFNVRDFGAKGDGTTDDTAAIQAAIEAARAVKSAVYVPRGSYKITSTLLVPSNVRFFGDGPYKTVITQATDNIPVIASRSWHAASSYAPGGGCEIGHMRINGSAGTDAHGILLRDFYSEIINVHVYDCGGNGIHVTDKNSSGTAIGSTLVEDKLSDIVVNRCVGWGIYVGDNDTVATTDGFLSNIVVQSRSAANGSSLGGIRFGSAAGWQMRQIHTYGSFTSYAVDIARCWHSVLDGVQIERGWVGVGLRLGAYQRGASLDNISISCGVNGGTALLVEGTTESTYVADGISIGSLSIIQDYDGAVIPLSWSRGNAKMRVASLSLQGTYQSTRFSAFGGFGAANIIVASDAANDALAASKAAAPLSAGISTMPRTAANSGTLAMTSGTLRLAYFTADKSGPMPKGRVVGGTTVAAPTPELVKLGLYSVAANGDLTLIASTANDPTIFATSGGNYSRDFTTPPTLVAGNRYAFGVLVVNSAATGTPTMWGASLLSGTELAQSPRVSGIATPVTDLPATIANGSIQNSGLVVYGAVSTT